MTRPVPPRQGGSSLPARSVSPSPLKSPGHTFCETAKRRRLTVGEVLSLAAQRRASELDHYEQRQHKNMTAQPFHDEWISEGICTSPMAGALRMRFSCRMGLAAWPGQRSTRTSSMTAVVSVPSLWLVTARPCPLISSRLDSSTPDGDDNRRASSLRRSPESGATRGWSHRGREQQPRYPACIDENPRRRDRRGGGRSSMCESKTVHTCAPSAMFRRGR